MKEEAEMKEGKRLDEEKREEIAGEEGQRVVET